MERCFCADKLNPNVVPEILGFSPVPIKTYPTHAVVDALWVFENFLVADNEQEIRIYLGVFPRVPFPLNFGQFHPKFLRAEKVERASAMLSLIYSFFPFLFLFLGLLGGSKFHFRGLFFF